MWPHEVEPWFHLPVFHTSYYVPMRSKICHNCTVRVAHGTQTVGEYDDWEGRRSFGSGFRRRRGHSVSIDGVLGARKSFENLIRDSSSFNFGVVT